MILYFLPTKDGKLFKLGICKNLNLIKRMKANMRHFSIDFTKAIYIKSDDPDFIKKQESLFKVLYKFNIPTDFNKFHGWSEIRPIEQLFPMLQELEERRIKTPALNLKISRSYPLLRTLYNDKFEAITHSPNKRRKLKKQSAWEINQWTDELTNDASVEKISQFISDISNRKVTVTFLDDPTSFPYNRKLVFEIEYLECYKNYARPGNAPVLTWNTDEPIAMTRKWLKKVINPNIIVQKTYNHTGELKALSSLQELDFQDVNFNLPMIKPFRYSFPATPKANGATFIAENIEITMTIEGLTRSPLVSAALRKLKEILINSHCKCLHFDKWKL